ncbi:hypothetical protein BK005_00915 [bacterium CG10_37_50]|nr:MAG: hypothetical protein BK005_00915 [bacterium CG10_37_50]
MTLNDLKIIGAMLYVCEGTKVRRDFRTKNGYVYSIELTNSDFKIIKIFSRFLKKIIEADWNRVKGQVFLYPDLVEKELVKYWSDASGIPINQFQKSIILKAKNGKFTASPFGTFKLRYACKDDFLKLQSIIKEVWRDARVV